MKNTRENTEQAKGYRKEKSLFGVAVGGASVEKYRKNDGSIMIKVSGRHDLRPIVFDDKAEYHKFLARVYDADGEGTICNYADGSLVIRVINFIRFGAFFRPESDEL